MRRTSLDKSLSLQGGPFEMRRYKIILHPPSFHGLLPCDPLLVIYIMARRISAVARVLDILLFPRIRIFASGRPTRMGERHCGATGQDSLALPEAFHPSIKKPPVALQPLNVQKWASLKCSICTSASTTKLRRYRFPAMFRRISSRRAHYSKPGPLVPPSSRYQVDRPHPMSA